MFRRFRIYKSCGCGTIFFDDCVVRADICKDGVAEILSHIGSGQIGSLRSGLN
jgi:hypothetical protein